MGGGNAEGEAALLRAIHTTPIIDNHAHPLLKPSSLGKHPLLTIASEAHGDALDSCRTGLAHFSAVKQLAGILGCDETWEAVAGAVDARRSQGAHEEWVARCLEGIQSVLVDDGLDAADDVEPYGYFDAFTTSASKRIVRIEHIAAGIIDEALSRGGGDARTAFARVLQKFSAALARASADPEVVGFKSVICYRTGLAIPRKEDAGAAFRAFEGIFEQSRANPGGQFTRVDHPGLNEYLVHLLAGHIAGERRKKPIQFHTGLGDNDITLTTASPAHLQQFIREYPTVPIVLLHSSYPYTREAGYLAAMYSNVYADIGEVFPFLSRDGQEGVVRQILELCPGSKILWSTDGHWFPETYLLAVEQVREVLATVLGDYVRNGDMGWPQAIQLVEDVFFNNSNKLYDLGLTPKKMTERTQRLPKGQAGEALQLLSKFDGGPDEPRFLRISWNDMTATQRCWAIPMRRVREMLRDGEELSFGAPMILLGVTQMDTPVPGMSPSGGYRMYPDLSSLRPGPRKGHVVAAGDFKQLDGGDVALCPRTLLKKTLAAGAKLGLEFTVGFEVELIIFRRNGEDGSFEPLDVDGHVYSGQRAMDHEAMIGVIEEAVADLDAAGVLVDMAHPESARGQYEVVLPKAPALEAVDTLLYARDVISARASAKGYRMTLFPKPFPKATGTACHAHVSMTTPTGPAEASTYEPFYAGVLRHLRAICAFTQGGPASYDRVQDGAWAGSTWVGWGTENREVPLRKIAGSHWEVRCLDGLANPYLALAALLGAGVDGVTRGADMGGWKDVQGAPGDLSGEERDALGVTERLPRSMGEALKALGEDVGMREILGAELVERYIGVKEEEMKLMEGMGEEEARRWVMERY